MLSLWAQLTERDVEAYVGSVVLPSYLAHLRLETFRFSTQPKNLDGREPLQTIYAGEGRLEEFELPPSEHALAMIGFVCPELDISKIQLPIDDACWHWGGSDKLPSSMKIYFASKAITLSQFIETPPPEEAYVSVTREQVFFCRAVIERYLAAWLNFLGVDGTAIQCEQPTRSGGIAFTADSLGGQWFLDDDIVAKDLIRFSGLEDPLEHVREFVRLDLDSAAEESGVQEDGVYVRLVRSDP